MAAKSISLLFIKILSLENKWKQKCAIHIPVANSSVSTVPLSRRKKKGGWYYKLTHYVIRTISQDA
jgi:hypothetical protein